MKLFDDLIALVNSELNDCAERVSKAEDVSAWRDEGENTLILGKEAAYELGADGTGHCATLLTADKSLVTGNSVSVVGKDLNEIAGNTPFCRVALVLADDIDEQDESAYREVQSVDFVKYHVFPEGYMLRISSEGGKEQVRVSKKALKDGISFAAVGKTYIERYLRNPHVKAVKLIFLSGDAAKRDVWATVAKKSAERIKALNKILKQVMLDCDVCALKPVCDEVEELRELHFGRNKNKDTKSVGGKP